MRILIAANNSMGLYIFRQDLIKRFVADGHEVYASLPDGECTERLKELGCNFIETDIDRRGQSIFKDIRLLLKYIKMLHRVKPDMVITYTIKPNVYCGFAAKLLGIPYAINITGLGTAFQKEGLLKKFAKFLYRVSCNKVKVVFTENEGIKEELCDMKLFPEEKICVLHGAGVNTEHFAKTEYPEEGLSTKFLFLGRIMKEKGVDELLEASAKLRTNGYRIETHVAGFFEEDYDRKLFDKCVNDNTVTFHGYLDDVRPLINDAHCFVLPSYHEGMANTLLECGAMGRPLITSRIHGCMEAVDEGKNGYTCTPCSPDALYEAMKRFVELPYGEKKCMGDYSHEFVSAYFDKKQVVQETVNRLY